MEQKKEIWLSTETGTASSQDCEDYDESSIDMDLEGELMYHIIEELSPQKARSVSDRSDKDDEF